jgi:hypothetical protein
MNKMLKNIVIFFAMLAGAAFLVFAVQLFSLNRDGGEQASAPTPKPPAETSPAAAPDASSGGASPAPPANTGGGEQASGGGNQAPAAPLGRRYALEMPGGAELVLYADEALFAHSELDGFGDSMGDVFTYLGGGQAKLEISFQYFPQGIAEFASGFLEDYIGRTFTAQSGGGADRRVGLSSLSGRYVSAVAGTETYEAWIVGFDGADLADIGLAIVVNYADDAQKEALYDILNSMAMA